MNKNLKYGLIFGGAALGAFVIVRLIQNAKKGDDTPDTPTTDTPVVVARNTKFDAIIAMSKDAAFKASVVQLQKAINRKLIGIAKQGEFISEDGYFGQNTYNALVRVMPYAVKDIDYLVSNPTKKSVDYTTSFLNK